MLSDETQKQVEELAESWTNCQFLEKFKKLGEQYQKQIDALKSVINRGK